MQCSAGRNEAARRTDFIGHVTDLDVAQQVTGGPKIMEQVQTMIARGIADHLLKSILPALDKALKETNGVEALPNSPA